MKNHNTKSVKMKMNIPSAGFFLVRKVFPMTGFLFETEFRLETEFFPPVDLMSEVSDATHQTRVVLHRNWSEVK